MGVRGPHQDSQPHTDTAGPAQPAFSVPPAHGQATGASRGVLPAHFSGGPRTRPPPPPRTSLSVSTAGAQLTHLETGGEVNKRPDLVLDSSSSGPPWAPRREGRTDGCPCTAPRLTAYPKCFNSPLFFFQKDGQLLLPTSQESLQTTLAPPRPAPNGKNLCSKPACHNAHNAGRTPRHPTSNPKCGAGNTTTGRGDLPPPHRTFASRNKTKLKSMGAAAIPEGGECEKHLRAWARAAPR